MSFPFFWFGGSSDDGAGGGSALPPPRLTLMPASEEHESATEDAELVELLRTGDETAFRSVWETLHRPLADFAYRYVRSEDAAADIVQQVFVTMWEERATLRPRSTISNYLYSAVRNRVRNVLRHDRVVQAYALYAAAVLQSESSSNDADVQITVAELQSSITRILDDLPPRTREIFLMSREDGLPPSEIARMLGISLQVVYNQLTRALKALVQGLRPPK